MFSFLLSEILDLGSAATVGLARPLGSSPGRGLGSEGKEVIPVQPSTPCPSLPEHQEQQRVPRPGPCGVDQQPKRGQRAGVFGVTSVEFHRNVDSFPTFKPRNAHLPFPREKPQAEEIPRAVRPADTEGPGLSWVQASAGPMHCGGPRWPPAADVFLSAHMAHGQSSWGLRAFGLCLKDLGPSCLLKAK